MRATNACRNEERRCRHCAREFFSRRMARPKRRAPSGGAARKEKRFWQLVVRSRRLQACTEHQSGNHSAALPLYSELLTEIQGFAPEFFYVIRPGVSFEPESYRLASFGAYYRIVKQALQDAVNTECQETYPEPVSHCDICRWWKECDKRRRGDDHLSFVAGRLQTAAEGTNGSRRPDPGGSGAASHPDSV